jgi:hypothetical protein
MPSAFGQAAVEQSTIIPRPRLAEAVLLIQVTPYEV